MLLTDEYRRLNWQLHQQDPHYGTTGRRYVELIRKLAKENSLTEILDYGCGKQDLAKALKPELKVVSYDPAIPGFDEPPNPTEFVACIDVLEHIERECLDTVLADLARVTKVLALITIATRLSGKTLADGTNCHRILESREWWKGKLEEYFDVRKCESASANEGVVAVCTPLNEPIRHTSGGGN